jgi:hypothetical protein
MSMSGGLDPKLRSLYYIALHASLLVAAEDCEARGHDKAVCERFRAAAAVCERVSNPPQQGG